VFHGTTTATTVTTTTVTTTTTTIITLDLSRVFLLHQQYLSPKAPGFTFLYNLTLLLTG